MTPRTTPCGPGERAGRWAKARQFFNAAENVRDLADEHGDVGDAYVTLCVHAGIAAADVICCARLGQFSRGENPRCPSLRWMMAACSVCQGAGSRPSRLFSAPSMAL